MTRKRSVQAGGPIAADLAGAPDRVASHLQLVPADTTAAETNDGSGLARLFAEVGRDLRRALQRVLRNAADADDVAQEACLKVWDRRHTIREDNPRGFLFRTATNLAIERKRAQKRRGDVVPLPLSDLLPVDPPLQDPLTPERHLGARDELAAVRLAFGRLTERQRRTFELSLEGHSQAAIASMLGISQSAVWKHLDRATALLHEARLDASRAGDNPASATVVGTGRKQ